MGRRFWKMSGSGNDFVVIDSRADSGEPFERPEAIQELSARGTGVGSDGVVFLGAPTVPGAGLAMRYYNADGTRATFCGNATLCVTKLAHELGLSPDGTLALETDSGIIATRMGGSEPEIDMPEVSGVVADAPLACAQGEQRMGFANTGVPHLVVLCDDIEAVKLQTRGAELRHDSWSAEGANANFVSRRADEWAMRTFERGVEGETLACGTGAIAAAVLLATWGAAGDSVALQTRSGRMLRVALRREGSRWRPTLSGEGRIVFVGELAEWRAGLDGSAS